MERTRSQFQRLRGVLWSADISKLDAQKDKEYIIHQTLMYGSLDDIEWLTRLYSLTTIREVFLHHPLKIYTAEALNFITKFILNGCKVNEERYLKTAPRITRR